MNNLTKNLLLWLVIAVVLMSVFNNFNQRQTGPQAIEYSQFVTKVSDGEVERVTIEGRNIRGVYKNGQDFRTFSPGDPGLVDDLLRNNVSITAKGQKVIDENLDDRNLVLAEEVAGLGELG